MNNFGVIELASTRTTNAPGWAYVPDTGPYHQQPQPTNRKRARGGNQAGGPGGALSSADVSARQEAKTRKEIELLDRDNHRDLQIAIPPKTGRSQQQQQQQQRKHTPNVRKILQSQKTFANHLDDFVALGGHADANPAISGGGGGATASSAAVATVSSSSRAAASAANANLKKSRSEAAAAAAAASSSRGASTAAHPIKQEDVDMADAPEPPAPADANPRSAILTPYTPPPPQPQPPSQDQPLPSSPPPHPLSDPPSDPLLASRVPPLPTDAELRALLSAPPLSYLEVRALSSSPRPRYPPRVFCGVCGYWGRVRCVKCGARVCALDCLEAHREECITRYGI